MKNISAVINARLGSTRVPNKLMRSFADSNLIEIALEKLNQMDFFQNRYLAVAEDELIKLANKYENVEVLKRNPEAVKPGVNAQETTFAHYLRVPTDYVFAFNPCLPAITVGTIKNAYDYFQSTNFPSYTSSIPTRDWVFDNKGYALTNSDPRNLTTNKGKVYHKAAHAFHIVNKNNIEKNGYHWTFTPNDPHLIEIPIDEAIDIDDMLDFEFAEFYYQQNKLNQGL